MTTTQSAFADLIAPHLPALFRSAYRLTGNRHDAEDVVQDVCARAYAHRATLHALEQNMEHELAARRLLAALGALEHPQRVLLALQTVAFPATTVTARAAATNLGAAAPSAAPPDTSVG